MTDFANGLKICLLIYSPTAFSAIPTTMIKLFFPVMASLFVFFQM